MPESQSKQTEVRDWRLSASTREMVVVRSMLSFALSAGWADTMREVTGDADVGREVVARLEEMLNDAGI